VKLKVPATAAEVTDVRVTEPAVDDVETTVPHVALSVWYSETASVMAVEPVEFTAYVPATTVEADPRTIASSVALGGFPLRPTSEHNPLWFEISINSS
jgi:hypothetical protein